MKEKSLFNLTEKSYHFGYRKLILSSIDIAQLNLFYKNRENICP